MRTRRDISEQAFANVFLFVNIVTWHEAIFNHMFTEAGLLVCLQSYQLIIKLYSLKLAPTCNLLFALNGQFHYELWQVVFYGRC